MRRFRLFLSKLSHALQWDNKLVLKVKCLKDRSLSPFTSFCAKFGITPNILTTIGLFFGLSAMSMLFVNFWLFVGLMLASMLFDILDGSLARNTKTQTIVGSRYDFMVDHVLMLLMCFGFSIYFHHPIWCIIPLIFSGIHYLNYKLGSRLTIPSGRYLVFIPAILGLLLGLPHLGLVVLSIYLIVSILLVAKELFYPLQNPALHGVAMCKDRVPVIHLSHSLNRSQRVAS